MTSEPVAPTRASRASRPSSTELFIEENADVQQTTTERAVGSEGEGQTFKHTTSKLVVVYFPTTWGWESREVPSTNLRLVTSAGARINCADCEHTAPTYGNCSPDPRNPQYNNCPGRPKFATMQCPMCGRLQYDFDARSVNADLLSDANPSRASDADGTLIEVPQLAASTPTQRLTASLTQHMQRYHALAAEARGLGRESVQVPQTTAGQ